MAKPPIVASKNTRVFLHARNISCKAASVQGTMTQPVLSSPTFCGIVNQPGIQDGKYTIDGYWSNEDPTFEEKLSQVFDGSIVPAYFVDAPYCAADWPCYGGEIRASAIKIASPVENVVTVNGELTLETPDRTYAQGFGPAYRGRILYYAGDDGITLAGGAGTTNGDAVYMGPSVGGRLYAHYHLSWVPATDYVNVSVQHSANGTTGWVAFSGVVVTLRADPSGPGDGVLTISWSWPTEDPYWRVVLTRVGANPKEFFNLFVWATVNTGAGAEGSYVMVQDGAGGQWVNDTDASDWVIQ